MSGLHPLGCTLVYSKSLYSTCLRIIVRLLRKNNRFISVSIVIHAYFVDVDLYLYRIISSVLICPHIYTYAYALFVIILYLLLIKLFAWSKTIIVKLSHSWFEGSFDRFIHCTCVVFITFSFFFKNFMYVLFYYIAF